MPPVLTFTPRTQPDPALDQMRAHLYRLLEPVTYDRLRPADVTVPHPAVVQDKAIRRYLEARNARERINGAFALNQMPEYSDVVEGVA